MNRIAKLFVVNAALWLATTTLLLSTHPAAAACPSGIVSCAVGDGELISTITVTSAANLDITGIPGTFSTLFVKCRLTPSGSAGNPLKMFYGTGGLPTWNVSYEWRNDERWTGTAATGGTGAFDASNSSAGTGDTAEAVLISTDINNVLPVMLLFWLNNYATATDMNTAVFKGSYWSGVFHGRDFFDGTVHGAVPAPITALRLTFGSGSISGSCSTYGMLE